MPDVKWNNPIELKKKALIKLEAGFCAFCHVVDQEIYTDSSGFGNLTQLRVIGKELRELRGPLRELEDTLPQFLEEE